ncbi:hypothetical protein G4B88_031473, partial [Cannabis sativa]
SLFSQPLLLSSLLAATATYLPRLLSAIHHRLSQMSTPMLPSSHFLPSNRKLLIDFESIVES